MRRGHIGFAARGRRKRGSMKRQRDGAVGASPPKACRLRPPPSVVGGTFAYHARVSELGQRYGPSSIAEYAAWPVSYMATLLGEGERRAVRVSRFSLLFHAGIAMHSDCSGRMSVEVMFAMMGEALGAHGVRVPPHFITPWRGADYLSLAQQIMLQSGALTPKHVFGNVVDRLPEKHRKAFVGLRPPRGASASCRAEAHESQRRYLVMHGKDIFGRTATSRSCVKHPGVDCEVSFRDAVNVPRAGRPLTMVVAGIPCTPFSPFGTREGLAQDAMEAVNLVIQDMATSQISDAPGV